MSLSLYLGGVRSGKSALAETAARDSGFPVTYVATARAADEEMVQRIQRHQAQRPKTWGLVEAPLSLSAALEEHAAEEHCLLIDSLAMWIANLLFDSDKERLDRERRAFLTMLPHVKGRLILVSDETSLGGISMDAVTRQFMDQTGQLHQDIAAIADEVILATAGLPIVIKPRIPT